ncbi:hypothetical protein WJX79_010910 [Trebouxia sp. C0005]
MSDDWDDLGSPSQQGELAREWNVRREQHYNSGYREGLDAGKEQTLQQGFDTGFLQGCTAGHEWGMLQGATRTLQVFAGQLHGIDTSKARALATRVDLPKKQVMLIQCDALLEQTNSIGTGADKSDASDKAENANQITSEVFVKPFTAAELKDLMTCVRSSLAQMQFNLDFRLESQQQCEGSGNAQSSG